MIEEAHRKFGHVRSGPNLYLTFIASASDTDIPANNLMFSLDTGAPAGAAIDPLTGAFSWTPTEAQGGSDFFEITVRVSNNGVPSLDDSETITVTVNEVTSPNDFVTVNFDDFESYGFDSSQSIWVDGGSDCRRNSNDAVYAIGTYCVRLRDDTSTSVMTTDNLALSGNSEIKVEFSYYPKSMDNSNEDFWLQISTDGGSSYTTVEEWNRNDEFINDQRYYDAVTISGFSLNNNVRLRFRCDASANGDYVYIDEVRISAK